MGDDHQEPDQAGQEEGDRGPEARASQAAYNPYAAARYEEWNDPPLTRRTQNVYQVRNAVGMETRNYYGGSTQPFYAPSDFGEARMACLGWLVRGERRRRARATRSSSGSRPPRTRPGPTRDRCWDWYYFQTLRRRRRTCCRPRLALSKGTDPAGLLAFLNRWARRRNASGEAAWSAAAAGEPKDNTPPLPADQLAHAVACFRKLKQTKPEWAGSGRPGADDRVEAGQARGRREGASTWT